MPSKHLKGRAVPLSAGSYQEEHPWSALLTGKLGYFSFLEQFLPTESGRGSYTGHHSPSPIPIPTHSGGRDEAPTYITDQLLFYLNQLLEIVLEQYSTHGTAWTPHEWPCSDTHHAHMQTCTHTHTHTHIPFVSWTRSRPGLLVRCSLEPLAWQNTTCTESMKSHESIVVPLITGSYSETLLCHLNPQASA